LRYTDPRRFGAMLWSLDPLNHELLIKLGPEPMTELFDGERLFTLSRGKSMAVKPFIMDNAVVVGVGNIYATEALFAAGIDPRREAGSISRARYLKLAIEIKRILACAIERGGTTLRDFVGGDGQPGYFQQELFVYGRREEPCKVCGSILREVKLGQRASVFCPRCQK
jgi:formamidopyrimidine-DNA glycosylase